MESALAKNFADASVKVCQCPDLTQEPFGLAAKGMYRALQGGPSAEIVGLR